LKIRPRRVDGVRYFRSGFSSAKLRYLFFFPKFTTAIWQGTFDYQASAGSTVQNYVPDALAVSVRIEKYFTIFAPPNKIIGQGL